MDYQNKVFNTWVYRHEEKKKKKKQHLKSFIKEKIMKNAKFLSTERKKNYKLQLF